MADAFPQTRWSLVLEAQGDSDAPAARRALGELCQIYWFPIYGYARRRGLSPHDAEDRTQAFFARLLERDSLQAVAPERGRMRAFLLTLMKRFLVSEWRNENTAKRGGGKPEMSIDRDHAEHRLARELASGLDSPDIAFERNWAHALLGAVYAKLEAYYVDVGQGELFCELRSQLGWGGDDDQSQGDVARRLGMVEGTVRTAVHRMRKRFRTLLEAEIRQTVESPAEAREELAHLKRMLAGG